MIDKYGREWKLDGDPIDGDYVCGGLRIGANAKDPLATMNAMAPEGWKPQQPETGADGLTDDERAKLKELLAKVQV